MIWNEHAGRWEHEIAVRHIPIPPADKAGGPFNPKWPLDEKLKTPLTDPHAKIMLDGSEWVPAARMRELELRLNAEWAKSPESGKRSIEPFSPL